MRDDHGLMERDSELDRLNTWASAASERRGEPLLVEGDPGIGKTALLGVAVTIARERGLRVVTARGGELEQEFAYGVVRQLIEPALATADSARRDRLLAGAASLAAPLVWPAQSDRAAPQPAPDPHAVAHGLYWLFANLAEEQPLALCVDDLQWADVDTQRFLVYLARRIEGMPITIVATVRLGEPAPVHGGFIDALRSTDGVARMELKPLSPTSVARWVADALGRQPEPGFSDACHELVRGNPYLLDELLRQLMASGADPTVATIERLRVGPSTAVSRGALVRIAHISHEAVALAQAVAVLGGNADRQHAAELAGISDHVALGVADALAEARILDPGRTLEFQHPLVRAAIYADLPTGRRLRDHARAARMLAASEAPPERIAGHLLLCEPLHEGWAVDALVAAAEFALARGAPDAAAAYLDRSLAEAPSPARRPAVLRMLGSAWFLAGDPVGSVRCLTEALDLTENADQRAPLALELSSMLAVFGRVEEAVALLEDAVSRLGGDGDLGRTLEAVLVGLAEMDVTTAAIVRDRVDGERLDGATPAQRLTLATLAFDHAKRGGDAAPAAAAMARRGLGGGVLFTEQVTDIPQFSYAVLSLLIADDFDAAQTAVDQHLAFARARGSLFSFGHASFLRSSLCLRRGALEEAVAAARDALNPALESGWPPPVLVSLGALIEARLEQGDSETAAAELAAAGIDEDGLAATTIYPLFLLNARGKLRVELGDLRSGVDDLLELGRRCEVWDMRNPSLFAWRSEAALALARLGDTTQARHLAAEELTLARACGAPRAIAIALRALSRIEDSPRGIELLQEAVSVTAESPAALTRAHALVDLGAALRRANQRSAARGYLSEGLGIAAGCNAYPLAQRAQEELRAAGARPRSVMRSGVDALTPSERRVCRLASEGLSNPEIAQSLFVTRATIETHLHAAYGKLGITSRGELADALKHKDP
jgi:DNA-binding NarL/FixJ family response regulator